MSGWRTAASASPVRSWMHGRTTGVWGGVDKIWSHRCLVLGFGQVVVVADKVLAGGDYIRRYAVPDGIRLIMRTLLIVTS